MKPLLYIPALALFVFTACRHQHAATQADASVYTTQPSQPTATSTSTTVTETGVLTTTNTNTSNTGNTNTTTVTASNPDTVVTTVTANNPPPADTTQDLYRISVSFISRGEGIDYKTQETFENWLKEHPKHPAYVVTNWGREGETNYCLKLNELSTREQEIFVRDVRTMLADNKLVIVDEHVPCKGRRVR